MRSLLCLCMLLVSVGAYAGGPRWVAGSQWTNAGKPMTWYRNDVRYFVDSGPLSSSVDHAAAVNLVNAAAAPWNLGPLPFKLTNGGELSEDVNADNVYLGQGGLVWPSDVTSANYTAKQIAVVLDADGSITDALLGSGASAPSSCRTNAVTETVDLFIQPGSIAHAIVIVNGRCTGPAQEQQLQLQYQLMRVFGRVIGLGWSQLNDNVFTGIPVPTYAQQLHWPIMHPIDVLCGPYTYQCLPQPFTLRDDDISAMWQLYADATTSFTAANKVNVQGLLYFANKTPMAGVNIVARRYARWSPYQADAFQDVSAVSGYTFAMNRGNPVTGILSDALGANGYAGSQYAWYVMGAVDISAGSELLFSSEPLNPLYVGSYSVGPYRIASPAPSGSPLNLDLGSFRGGDTARPNTTVTDAASDCTTGADGTESAPVELSADGAWNGRLCSQGHTSWFAFPVKAGRSATVEATATNETGAASAAKAMPVIGLWHGSDAAGTLPGLAAARVPLNATQTGMTQLRASFKTAETVRLAIADARGDGRPDYTYRMRVLYADSATPSNLTSAGGTVVITGTGFSAACAVTVGGVAARIVSQSATQLQVVAPSAAALRSTGAKDVVVTDRSTGGTATITGGLIYAGSSSDVLRFTSQPAAAVPVGSAATMSLLLMDSGGKPVRNGEIVLSAVSGSFVFSACNLSSCTLVTDANGMAQTSLTPTAAGTFVVRATSSGGSVAEATVTATQISRAVTLLRPTQYVASGAGALFHPSALVIDGGSAAAGQAVTWSASTTRTALSTSTTATDGTGLAMDAATGSLRDGETATVQACAWATVCASGNVVGVAASNLRATAINGDVQNLTVNDTLRNVSFRVIDIAGHAVAGATVGVYQAVFGWQPPCSGNGRCPAAPVYGKASYSTMSDDDGLVTVAPLQYAETAAVTKITATVGTQAAVTVTVQKTP